MSDALLGLLRLNLVVAVAVAVVMALRLPVRRLFGPRVAYGLWSLVPLAGLALALAPLGLTRQRVVVHAVHGHDVVDDVDLAAHEALLGEPPHDRDVVAHGLSSRFRRDDEEDAKDARAPPTSGEPRNCARRGDGQYYPLPTRPCS